MVAIVSFRLPVIYDDEAAKWKTAPGGLVSALGPALRRVDATWYGCSGTQGVPLPDFGATRLANLPIAGSELDTFHRGYCNRALWPAMHGLDDYVEEDEIWWTQYAEVNRRTADVLAADCAEGEHVWFHDYHFLLAPSLLRRQRPDLRIGLFLHTPVCAESIGRLQHAEELRGGLAGADVVGCQTETACNALGDLLGDGPTPMPQSHPVGVDVDHWEELSQRSDVRTVAARLRPRRGHLLVGVDRLDYTKGIPQRLLAIEYLLATHELRPDDVRLIQVAIPTRTSIPAYQQLRAHVTSLTNRINGTYRRSDDNPVVELREHSHDPRNLAALYRSADALLATPVRDGMNLVAAEFATVNRDRASAIVLSRGAGIHELLHDAAFTVEGYDVLSIAEGISAALHAEPAALARQAETAGERVRDQAAATWASRLLEALDGTAGNGSSSGGCLAAGSSGYLHLELDA